MDATVRLSSCTFLSTPSGWRATKDIVDANNAQLISIHALRVEGDPALIRRAFRGF